MGQQRRNAHPITRRKLDSRRPSGSSRSAKRMTLNKREMSISDPTNRKLAQRVALQNNFEGNVVNTNQNIQEFNRDPWDSDSIDDALDDLTEALRGIFKNNGKDDEQQIANVDNALQRVAIQNNIKGNTVNTNQNVQEYNEELVGAIEKAVPRRDKNDRRQNLRIKSNLDQIAEELRRVAIKNDIKGDVVNTHQNIQEFNNDVVRTIVKAIRRIAIQNKIKGNKVNTNQNVQEFNDNEHRRAQRLSIGNQITGNVVSTKQNVAELNNDETTANDENNESNDSVKKVNNPFKASIKIGNNTHEFQVDPELSKPKPKVVKEVEVKEKVSQDEDKTGKSNQPKDDDTRTRRMGVNSFSRSNLSYMQHINNMLRGQSQGLRGWNFGQSQRRRMYSDEKDDESEKDDEESNQKDDDLVEGEISKDSSKRSGKESNSETDDESLKRESETKKSLNTRRSLTATSNPDTRRSGKDMGNGDNSEKQSDEKASNSQSNALKDFECKLKNGKKISDADLKEFLNLLEKVKSAQKISDALKTE